MTKSIKRIIYIISALFIGLVVIAMDYFSVAKRVSADDDTIYHYDDTSIMKDLSDIDTDLYPKDENGNHELIRFMEYCYSTRAFYKDYFGLYLYVYNPSEKAVSRTSNVVNMAVEYNSEGKPSAYENVPLTYLDATSNNRFLKFKVTESRKFLEKAQEYATEHNGERRYDIVGIQLCFYDGTSVDTYEIKDEKVAKSYVWTGFAAGLGVDQDAGSTLSCKSDTEHTLSLDVRSTYYRPEASNGKSRYTQDSLHSVYFAVPNRMLELYGDEISSIHATWLEAMLNPMLVTGNIDAYNAIRPYLGKNIDGSGVEYGYFGAYTVLDNALGYYADFTYYDDSEFSELYDNLFSDIENGTGYDFNYLYYMFYSGDGEDSADNYIVKSEDILAKIKNSYKEFGGNPIKGGEAIYSDKIFSSVASSYIEKYIKSDDNFSLCNATLNTTWWDRIWGGSYGEVSWTKNIKAIQPIYDKDLTRDATIDSVNLFISKNEMADFYDYFDMYHEDNTIFVFRYRVSDYISEEASLFKDDSSLTPLFQKIDSNAYFFQQSMDLGFEIIDVTFNKNGVETVIGVVMSPMDIVHDGTSPLETTSDEDTWFEKLLKLFLSILLLILIAPLLPYIINGLMYVLKGAWYVITAPFKFIAWLIRKFRE